MERAFPELKKKLGFGCMRLPMRGDAVDHEAFSAMVDCFIENGFNYFDTAQGYIGGQSETSIKACLTDRYPREAYILTDKLSEHLFQKEEDIRPAFERQLAACGVSYFDFYLMHAQNRGNLPKYRETHAYEVAAQLRAEGRIRHVGISFHDTADVLDGILMEFPQIEVVQLQFNYLDYEDEGVQARRCYEVCRRHGKPVFVMEPVKGGALVNLPRIAQDFYDELGGGSNASYAIRFAAGFEGVEMVLSGMGSMDMMRDNVGYMADFRPLDARERAAVEQVCAILKNQDVISCTACRYCVDGCPQKIVIPAWFSALNARRALGQEAPADLRGGKPTDCIRCGRCEKICPQHLEIRRLLETVAAELND